MAIFKRNQRVASSRMPANAARTTARKAYATAIQNERRTASQKANDVAASWSRPQITKAKKGQTGSLKVAGQRTQNATRQASRTNTASSWDNTRNAFRVK